MLNSNPRSKAFTLIELMVVISIIALLSVIVLASLNNAKASGRDARKLQLVKQYANALELYRTTNGAYPGASNSTITLSDGNLSTANLYCLGEVGTCFINASGNASLNTAIAKYIPGPPADTDAITIAGVDFHGLTYGYCATKGTLCANIGDYILKWYMEGSPNCAAGTQNTLTSPYSCTYESK